MIQFISKEFGASPRFNRSYTRAAAILNNHSIAQHQKISLFWRADNIRAPVKQVLYDPVWWLDHHVNYSNYTV